MQHLELFKQVHFLLVKIFSGTTLTWQWPRRDLSFFFASYRMLSFFSWISTGLEALQRPSEGWLCITLTWASERVQSYLVLYRNMTKVRITGERSAITQPCISLPIFLPVALSGATPRYPCYFLGNSFPDTFRILLGWFSLELSNLWTKTNFHLASVRPKQTPEWERCPWINPRKHFTSLSKMEVSQ